jgi:hypothetical protein
VVGSRAGQLNVILHQHAVVRDGHPRGARQLAIFIKMGGVKNDVVGLPLSRRPCEIVRA